MKRAILSLHMELLSDAIFGAGFSVPGGEDISVYTDAEGYPYFKATSLKGLLRESLLNLLSWKDLPETEADRLLGETGWEGTDDGSRVFLTDLELKNKPEDPGVCFARRCFTSLENGIVKEGTLREAVCICAGQVFEGSLICAEDDAELIAEALSLIKWVGSSRNRGFGAVSLRCAPATAEDRPAAVGETRCLRYVLHTELPLIVTKLSSSSGNGYETRNYIPGSSVRGFVAGKLAQEAPDWFRDHKEGLLSDSTRFLNAFPTPAGKPAIPSLMGFYEDKAESRFESVLLTDIAGLKRAKIGAFCAPEGETLTFWNTASDGYTRIDRSKKDEDNNTLMFQTRHISAGQDFTGYILLDDPSLAETIASVFSSEIWLGADRYEGFGKCSLKMLEAAEEPAYVSAYGYGGQDSPDPVLYMTVLSPTCMLDENGEPCGLNLQTLAERLGVGSIREEELLCSSSVSEYGGYNRTWTCREPAVRMYDGGSVFRLVCERAPSAETLRRLQSEGLGIRRAEGFGQVLFLRKELYEGLRKKQGVSAGGKDSAVSGAAALRRAKMRWVMDHVSTLQKKDGKLKALSRSQIGTLQALCEQAVAEKDASAAALLAFLEKAKENTMAKERRYRDIAGLISRVLNAPLSETLDLPDLPDDDIEKLRLLVMLFDHSRK